MRFTDSIVFACSKATMKHLKNIQKHLCKEEMNAYYSQKQVNQEQHQPACKSQTFSRANKHDHNFTSILGRYLDNQKTEYPKIDTILKKCDEESQYNLKQFKRVEQFENQRQLSSSAMDNFVKIVQDYLNILEPTDKIIIFTTYQTILINSFDMNKWSNAIDNKKLESLSISIKWQANNV